MGAGAAVEVAESLRTVLAEDCLARGDGLDRYRLGGRRPAAAALPTSEAQVSAVLRLAHDRRWGVVPWGGGAHQSSGRVPSRFDVALDLRALDRVVRYEPADMTVTVEAGIRLQSLQERLATSGQFLPLDPPGADRATLGGVVAANCSGPLRCRYGTLRDLVLGVRVVHADGTLTKAGAGGVKNATAYDLTKLYVGSHGTLGVIVGATLRVQPKPACEESGWMAASSLEHAMLLVRRILNSEVAPSRLELLEAVGARACGFPGDGPHLAVSVAGRPDAVAHQMERLAAIAAECEAQWSGMEHAVEAWRRIREFPGGREDGPLGGEEVRWRAGVLPADSAAAMRSVAEAVAGEGSAAMAASVTHGVVRGALRASFRRSRHEGRRDLRAGPSAEAPR